MNENYFIGYDEFRSILDLDSRSRIYISYLGLSVLFRSVLDLDLDLDYSKIIIDSRSR